MKSLGLRGVHFRQIGDKMELRKYIRKNADQGQLTPTEMGIELTGKEWAELRFMSRSVGDEVRSVKDTDKDPEFFQPIGENGVHVVVNEYKGHVLVQVRKFFRPIKEPTRLLPTRQGIALKVDEWQELEDLFKKDGMDHPTS